MTPLHLQRSNLPPPARQMISLRPPYGTPPWWFRGPLLILYERRGWEPRGGCPRMSRWGFHEMAKFEITPLHLKRSNRQMISIEVPEMRWLGSRSSLNIPPPGPADDLNTHETTAPTSHPCLILAKRNKKM